LLDLCSPIHEKRGALPLNTLESPYVVGLRLGQ
jgi:hypothetical protein